jgi:hypothetical protein
LDSVAVVVRIELNERPGPPLSISGPGLDRCNAVGAAHMTESPITQVKPSVPLLEAFWGKGDAAQALFRECQEIIARKYGSDLNSNVALPGLPVAAPRKPRKPRPPSLTHIAAQAKKAGIDVARIEVAADGSYVVVSKDEHQQGNEVDQWIAKHACALERH